jgi:hypothetical protein
MVFRVKASGSLSAGTVVIVKVSLISSPHVHKRNVTGTAVLGEADDVAFTVND